jgi:hypothetical protein
MARCAFAPLAAAAFAPCSAPRAKKAEPDAGGAKLSTMAQYLRALLAHDSLGMPRSSPQSKWPQL